MKNLLFIFCCTLTSISSAQFNRLDISTVNSIDSIVNIHKTANNWVGMSVGIIKDGEVVFLDGYGVVDKTTSIAASMFSVYRLASISKCFTGVLTLKLAEIDSLDIGDFVQQYVPEYPSTNNKNLIKLKHLLSNESGIPNYGGCGICASPQSSSARTNYINSHGNYYDPVSAIDVFKNQAICFTPPGTNYLYTTFGFCLLAAVIERASGTSYQDFLFDNIACPMQMPTLQIEFQDRVPYPSEVTGYQYTDSAGGPTQPSTITTADISYKTGGGGLIGSVTDLTLFMQGLVNNNFINDSMVTVMGTSHSSTQAIYSVDTICNDIDSGSSTYGYGTNRTFDYYGNRIYYHGGDQAKTATYIRYSPDSKHGVVIMCNTESIPGRYGLCKDIYYELFNATLSSSPVFSPLLYTWDVPPTSTHINPGTYESNYGIHSTGQVHTGDNTKLKAYKKINLKTGFEAVQGSYFKAKVNNCD